jgi:hypothetical protein
MNTIMIDVPDKMTSVGRTRNMLPGLGQAMLKE